MIAKNGDRIQVVENGGDGAVSYTVGQQGEMVNKAPEDDCGGIILLDSGDQVYLYADEYEVIGQNTHKETPMTAEALQHSYKALEDSLVSLQQQVSQTEAEKVKIVEQLKEMGFALIPGTLVKEQEVVFHKKFEDYSDPFKWKEGYTVKCINDQGWCGEFVSGGIYKVRHAGRICGVIVFNEYSVEQDISLFMRDFEFYSPF